MDTKEVLCPSAIRDRHADVLWSPNTAAADADLRHHPAGRLAGHSAASFRTAVESGHPGAGAAEHCTWHSPNSPSCLACPWGSRQRGHLPRALVTRVRPLPLHRPSGEWRLLAAAICRLHLPMLHPQARVLLLQPIQPKGEMRQLFCGLARRQGCC